MYLFKVFFFIFRYRCDRCIMYFILGVIFYKVWGFFLFGLVSYSILNILVLILI